MSKDMLGPLTRALVGVPMRMLGILLDIANRLGSADGENFFNDLAKFVREWRKKIVETAGAPLLELLSTSVVLATNEPFVASKKFKLKRKGGICSNLGENFSDWFLGKIEDPMPETMLQGYKLKRNAFDTPIIREQGGEAKVETTLAEVFFLMEKQPNGEDGALLNDGSANIFYVLDQSDWLRAVYVYRFSGGWEIGAINISTRIPTPDGWFAGNRFFFRKYNY